jgi:hypothetical protein
MLCAVIVQISGEMQEGPPRIPQSSKIGDGWMTCFVGSRTRSRTNLVKQPEINAMRALSEIQYLSSAQD